MAYTDNDIPLNVKASHDLPAFVRDDFKVFAAFVDAYHTWLEQNQADVRNLSDLDRTIDSFIRYFKTQVDYRNLQFGHIDERMFLRNIKQLYLSKGTEESYKTLFRMLYNKEASLYYPENDTLKTSAGKWIQIHSIFVETIAGNASEVIDKVVKVTTAHGDIEVIAENAILRKTGGGLSTVALSDGGTGYTTPTVEFVGGGGFGATGHAVVVGGVITEIRIDTPGESYTSQPQVVITGANTTPAVVSQVFIATKPDVYEINIDRRYTGTIAVGDTIYYNGYSGKILPTINKVTITNGGSNFKLGQLFNVDTLFGTGTLVKVTKLNATGGVSELQFIKYGFGYLTDFTSDNIIPPNTITTVPIQGFTGTNGSFTDYVTSTPSGGYILNETFSVTPTQDVYAGDYAGDIVREFYTSNQYNGDITNAASVQFTLGAVCKYPGFYANSDGKLSDTNRIHDGFLYQKYSYVIKVDEQLDAYKDIVKSLVHPSGLELFGEYDIRNDFNVQMQLESLFSVYNIRAEDVVIASQLLYTYTMAKEINANTYLLFGGVPDETANTDLFVYDMTLAPFADSASGADSEVFHFVGNKYEVMADTTDTHVFDVLKTLNDVMAATTDTKTWTLGTTISDASNTALGNTLDWTNNTDTHTYSMSVALVGDTTTNTDTNTFALGMKLSDSTTPASDAPITYSSSLGLLDTTNLAAGLETFILFMPAFTLQDSFSVEDRDINNNIPFLVTFNAAAIQDAAAATDSGSVLYNEYVLGQSTWVAGDYIVVGITTF